MSSEKLILRYYMSLVKVSLQENATCSIVLIKLIGVAVCNNYDINH